jgi:hypothetical protein
LTPPITVEAHPGGSDGTIVPTGRPAAACWAAAAAAAAFAAAACAAAAFEAAACAAAAFAAAVFAAAAFAAAALVTATVETTAASLYIERRATPATERGVRGMPMIASALLMNPNSATERKITAAASTVDIKNDFIDLVLPNELRYEKSEIRISKSEIISKFKIPKSKTRPTRIVWNI